MGLAEAVARIPDDVRKDGLGDFSADPIGSRFGNEQLADLIHLFL